MGTKNKQEAIVDHLDSGTVYYAMSFYLPTNWSATNEGWELAAEIHGPAIYGISPLWSLCLGATWRTAVNLGDMTNAGNTKVKYYAHTDGGELQRGKWTDFILKVKYSRRNDGELVFYQRVEGMGASFKKVLSITGQPVFQWDTGKDPAVIPRNDPSYNHYFMQGLYRQSVNRTDTFWMGPTVRASTFEAAEFSAFGTLTGTPP